MSSSASDDRAVPGWNTLAFVLLTALLPASVLVYGAVHPISLAVTYVVIGFCATVVLVARLFGSQTALKIDWLSAPLLLASLYCLIQIIPFGTDAVKGTDVVFRKTISVDVFWTALTSVQFLFLAVFLILMQSLISIGNRLKVFVTVVVVFAVGYAFFAILQSIISPGKIYGVYEVSGASPFGSFVNRHNFAALTVMALAIPLALVMGGSLERDRKFLLMVICGLLGTAILLSGSRGGLVAMVAMVISILLLVQRGRGDSKRSFRKQLILIVLLVSGLIGGIAFVGGENTFSRVAETASTGDISTNRLQIWGVTLEVIKEHLPFGAGFGAFRTAYAPFDPTSGIQRVEQSHNDYLQVVADGGIPGIFIGIGFLFGLSRTVRKALSVKDRTLRTLAIGATCAVFAVLVHSLFDFVLHTTAIALLFLSQLAVLSFISSHARSEMDAQEATPTSPVVEFSSRQD